MTRSRHRLSRKATARGAAEAGLSRAGLYLPLRDLYHRLFKPAKIAERRRSLDFLRTFVPRGGLVFDIGANNGRFTELYLRLGATVVALEPNPVLASAVKRRFGSRRLTVVQAAVGATAGCGQLRIGVDDVYSTLSADWVEHTRALGLKERWAETIAVGVVTLDELVERHGMPHFIKVDVEGFEPEVLRGLSRLVPALSFEFQSSALDLARECIDVLEHVGRREYTFSGPEQLSFERAGWTGAQELLRELEIFGAGHANVHGDVYARSLEI